MACASRSKRRSVSCDFLFVAGAEHFGANQLDRRVAREQAMFGAPDLAHAAVSELFDQLIAAKLLRFLQAPADAMEHLRRDDDDEGARISSASRG